MAPSSASLGADVARSAKVEDAARRASRSASVPTEHDLKQAREDSLLQLRIGRTANFYAIVLFVLLFLDGLLIEYINPYGPGLPILGSLYFLVFPLMGALLLAFFGLAVKWEAYQIWPWESHFWLTILSVLGAVGAAYLLLARIGQFGATATWPLLPWMVPVALGAISLPLVGLALTWQDWTSGKTGAIVAALLPVPLGFTLYLPTQSNNPIALTLVLLASAGLYLLAASLLHLISSGTQAHEREVIVSGQSRLYRFSDELRDREDAMHQREATLLRREADVEVAEASVVRKVAAVEDVRARLADMERDLEERAQSVHQNFQQASSKISESAAIQRELTDRESRVLIREQEIDRWEGQRQGRETKLSEGEGELVRRQLELGNLEKELLERQAAVPLAETKLQGRRQELDRRETELRRREAAAGVAPPVGPGTSVDPKSMNLAEREGRLAQLEKVLAEQNVALGARSKDLESRSAESKKLRDEQAQREASLAAREVALNAREADATRRLGEASERQRQYGEALERVEQRAKSLEQQQGGIAGQLDEIRQRSSAIEVRESTTARLRAELDQSRADLERSEREVARRQRELDARELQASARPPTPAARTPGTTAAAASVPGALRTGTPATGLGRGVGISTGVARLDELLGGGLRERSQLLLVGPPFIGKEVVAYTFLADGLAKGDSIVVLTTDRTPPEIAQELSGIAPQFREHERQGRVQWIDASNPTANPRLDASGRAGMSVVKGPADFTGILTAVAAATGSPPSGAPGHRYRVAVLNLSACMRQGDPKAAYGFVHNLVSILKQKNAVGLYGVEPGTVDESQVQSALARMDGAIQFRADRGKTLLAIQGAGDVATRDWVEYHSTSRALTLGSFTLERIR